MVRAGKRSKGNIWLVEREKACVKSLFRSTKKRVEGYGGKGSVGRARGTLVWIWGSLVPHTVLLSVLESSEMVKMQELRGNCGCRWRLYDIKISVSFHRLHTRADNGLQLEEWCPLFGDANRYLQGFCTSMKQDFTLMVTAMAEGWRLAHTLHPQWMGEPAGDMELKPLH